MLLVFSRRHRSIVDSLDMNQKLLFKEKGKVKGPQLCPTLCNPMDYIVHAYSPSIRVGSPSPGDLPNPGIKARSPALQADSLPAHQGSLRVGSLIPSPTDLTDP